MGVRAMSKRKVDEQFEPEKYGMLFCPACGGAGRALTDTKGFNVCKVCGGFGLLKKEEERKFLNKPLIGQSFR